MADGIDLHWEGMDEVVSKLQAYPIKVMELAPSALYIEGEELMSVSKHLVPVDTGTLLSSGFVKLPELDDEDQVFVEVGFGGPAGSGNQDGSNDEDVGYAVYVHENLEAHHPHGQAKYLEQPFNERKDTMAQRIAQRIGNKI